MYKNRVALLLLAMTSVAQAAAPSDLIVRFREPEAAKAASLYSLAGLGLTGTAEARIVNGEEGLVRLRFRDAAEAGAARAQLERSGQIAHVAPNFLYRPAMNFRFQPVSGGESFLKMPFPSLTEAFGEKVARPAPEVNAPPTSILPGIDPLAAQDWAVAAIHLDRVRRKASPSMITAVIDTGVDYNHEDLSGAMWRSPVDQNVVGRDFAHDNAYPYDQVKFDVQGCMADFACRLGLDTKKFLVNPGHGTHCAGHVAAVYNNSTGIRGVGAGAKVMALKFFYDEGEENAGQGDDAAAIKSIDYAIQNGVKVISASWGGREKRAEAESSELKNALIRARDAGVIVVIAAGNDAVDQDSVEDPSYPAAYDLDNLIVVAATDKNDALGEFSSYGKRSVHIAAPGVKILSTTVGNHYSDTVASFTDSSGSAHTMNWDGTSMATPIVAGAVALVWSRYPNADYHEIRNRILSTARPVPGLVGKVSTGGVLDVAAATQ